MGRLADEAIWSGTGLGCVPRQRLITRLCKSREALHRTLYRLNHPHAAEFAGMRAEGLQAEVLRAATFWVKTCPKKRKPEVLDVILAKAFEADISPSLRHQIFGGVSLENQLAAPVTKRLRGNGYEVLEEVPVRYSRADLVGFRHGLLERKIWTVELKNAAQEVQRLEAQVEDYIRASDHVAVVMTPECAVEVSLCRDELATPMAFAKRVENWGAQLWSYDATVDKFDLVSKGTGEYVAKDYDALWESLTAQRQPV